MVSDAPINMFDHTIDSLPNCHKNFHLTREPGNTENFIRHVNSTSPASNKIFLKMDIEGHEWDIFNNINEVVLCRFEQMVIEFHNLEFLQNQHFPDVDIKYSKMINVFSKLNKFFYLRHIHGNNCGGFKDLPNTVECTYIRKDLLDTIPEIEKVAYPIPGLDFPNTECAEEYTLDWWVKPNTQP